MVEFRLIVRAQRPELCHVFRSQELDLRCEGICGIRCVGAGGDADGARTYGACGRSGAHLARLSATRC